MTRKTPRTKSLPNREPRSGCRNSLRTDLALDTLERGLWTRLHAGKDTAGLIAHPDKEVQYFAVRYTQRLAEAGPPSVEESPLNPARDRPL